MVYYKDIFPSIIGQGDSGIKTYSTLLAQNYKNGSLDTSWLGNLLGNDANGGVNIIKYLDNNILTDEKFRQAYSSANANRLGLSINNEQSILDKAKTDYLTASTSAQEANRALGITNGVFQGLGALTNAGLGIWGAIESNKNLKKQREVADKQIALAEEQIQASRQYRNERAKEIERLNRVRSNTTKAFNTGSVITRSY